MTTWTPVPVSRLETTHDLPIKFVELVKHLIALEEPGDNIVIEEDRSPMAGLCCWRVQSNLCDIDLELTCKRFGFQVSDSITCNDEGDEYHGEEGLCYSNPDVSDSDAKWWLDQIGTDILIHDC